MWANYTSSGCKFPTVYMSKNYENWLTVDKVIAKISRLTFLAHPVDEHSILPPLATHIDDGKLKGQKSVSK